MKKLDAYNTSYMYYFAFTNSFTEQNTNENFTVLLITEDQVK